MRIEPSEGHLWGGVYLDPDTDDIIVQAVIEAAQRLYPEMGLHHLRMEPMIAVAHSQSNKDQEQECAEFIVRELERMAA